MFFQGALLCFALFAVWRVTRQYTRHEVSGYWALLWSLMWGVVMVVALVPQMTDAVARIVGVGRGADLLVYIAVVTLLYVTHRLLVRQQVMQSEITELVRSIALRDAKKE